MVAVLIARSVERRRVDRVSDSKEDTARRQARQYPRLNGGTQ